MASQRHESVEKVPKLNPKCARPACGKLPVRFVLSFLLCLGNCIVITMRVSINIAIVAMVRFNASQGYNETTVMEATCAAPNRTTDGTQTELQTGSFDWSPSVQGVIVGGFFYGYICTQIFGGRLSERFGPKLVFVGGILGSSVMTLLIPIVAETSHILLIVVRILTGAFQGFAVSAMYHFVSNWFPMSERGLHLSLALSGLLVGNVITMPAVGYLCRYGFSGGWPSAFYLFGAIGLAYTIPAFLLTTSRPEDHPRISEEELVFIQSGLGKPKKAPPIPWSKLLRSAPVWILGILRFSSGSAYHIIQTKIPPYLTTVLNFPIEENGLLNAGFYFSKTVTGICAGQLSDVIIRRKIFTVNTSRKVFSAIASLGAASCLIAVPLVNCNGMAVVILLTLCLSLHGFQNGGEMPVAADLAPAYSGTVFGLTNSFASAAGFIAPSVAGLFLDGNDLSLVRWSYVYFLNAGFCACGYFIFLVFGSAKRLSWGQGDSRDKEHSTATIASLESSQDTLEQEKQRY